MTQRRRYTNPKRLDPEAKAARAAARAGKPAVRDHVELADRLHANRLNSLLWRVMHNARPGIGKGKKAHVWDVPFPPLFEACRRCVIDNEPPQTVWGQMDLAPASKRGFESFVAQMRRQFAAELGRLGDDAAATAEIDVAGGDLVAAMGGLVRIAMRRVAPYLHGMEWGEMAAADRHVTLRFLEFCGDFAKTFAEARRTEAQTERLVRMLQATVSDAERRGSASVTLASLHAVIAEAIGLPVQPAQAERAQSPATPATIGPDAGEAA